MYYIIDAQGFITSHVPDGLVTAETPVETFYTYGGGVGHTQVDPPAHGTYLKPKFDGTTWGEGATQAEIDSDLVAYANRAKRTCVGLCDSKLVEVHGSIQTIHEHAAKWREANTVKNVATKGPQALRDDAGTSNTPYIDEHIAEFGGTADAAADAIIAAEWVDAQKGAKIARYRKRAITDIDAATDRAGVDTALTNLTTNLATI